VSSHSAIPLGPTHPVDILRHYVDNPTPCQRFWYTAAPFIAEFFGTFMLAVTYGCTQCVQALMPRSASVVGLVYFVLHVSLSGVSGGHLNPAVSIAVGASRRKEWPLVAGFVVMQLLAGVMAGSVCSIVFRPANITIGPRGTFGWWQPMVIESMYTMMLCFVFLNVHVSQLTKNWGRLPNQFDGLAVGLVVIAAGLSAVNVSGAVINPALSVGFELMGVEDGGLWGGIYCIYHVAGALIACLLFRICRPEESLDEIPEGWVPRLPTKLAAEFVGTLLVSFTVGVSILTESSACPWSYGAAVASLSYALADVSGAHFNPVVTVVMMFRSLAPPLHGVCYVILQALGGILGTIVAVGICDPSGAGIEVAPLEPYTLGAAIMLELCFTAVVVFVVLGAGQIPENDSFAHGGKLRCKAWNFYYGLAIGLAITGGSIASRNVSGGWMNPAIVLGASVGNSLNAGTFSNFWNYSVAEFGGGMLAILTFFLTHPREMLPRDTSQYAQAKGPEFHHS